MYRQNKLQPIQPGPYDTNANVDFDVQHYGAVDMSKSYFNVQASITSTAQGPGAKQGIFNVRLVGPNNAPMTNACMIKDVRHDIGGTTVQDTHASNVLTQNLAMFTRDFEDMRSDNYELITANAKFSLGSADTWGSPFRELERLGSTASKDVTPDLRIPASDILSLGNSVLSTDKLHGVRLTIDKTPLSVEKNRPFSNHVPADSLACDDYTNATGGDVDYGLQANPLVITPEYSTPDQFPLHVGESIQMHRP